MKKILMSTAMASALIIPLCISAARAETARSVMAETIRHARGPEGKTVVSRGIMAIDEIKYYFTTARVFMNGCEGVLVVFQGQTSSADAGTSGNVKWQTVRCANISMASYIPSLRRGRRVNSLMLHMMGGELTPYLMLTATSWERDYAGFVFLDKTPNAPVIQAYRSEGSLSPFTSCVWHLEKQHGVYIPLRIACEHPEGPVKQVFSEYKEIAGADGYYAPSIMMVGEYTGLTFQKWGVTAAKDMIVNANHALLGERDISFR